MVRILSDIFDQVITFSEGKKYKRSDGMLFNDESTTLLGKQTTSNNHISFVIHVDKQSYIEVMQAYAPRVDECFEKQNNDSFNGTASNNFR